MDWILGVDPGLKGAVVLLYKGNPFYSIELSKAFNAKEGAAKAPSFLDPMKLAPLLRMMSQSPETILPEAIAIELPLCLPGLANRAIATAHTNWGILFATLKMTYPMAEVVLIQPRDWVSTIHSRFCQDPHNITIGVKTKTKECFKRVWPNTNIHSTEGSRDAALIGFYHLWKNNALPTTCR